ncbi:MAG: type III pantothenate kinase, partial [Limnobacter sp.]|nr:type III pantothenate kinase [Limnobacter sp.]
MSKVLLVDAGNSRVKWLVADTTGGYVREPGDSGFVETGAVQTTEEIGRWADSLKQLTQEKAIDQVVLSNVLGAGWQGNLAQCLSPLRVVCPKKNQSDQLFTLYSPVGQLGLDRWFSCLAASHMTDVELNLVVSFGTATTVDAVVQSSLLPDHHKVPYVHLGGVI